ncbi:MAG: hypothetical protein K0M56_04655 [Kaistella sp.]|nr:hypothetical protein [Kaistella sp.]
MRKILFILLLSIFFSCVSFKNDAYLENPKNIYISEMQLKTEGYFYRQSLFKPTSYFNTTEDVKMIHAFFINQDGFTYELQGINGIIHYLCTKEFINENSFENAHKNISKMVQIQKENKIKLCNFYDGTADGKGLTKIYDQDSIKIQIYRAYGNGNNSYSTLYHLQEYRGKIINDSTFIMKKSIDFYNNKKEDINEVYHFRKSDKPNLSNYFINRK